MFGLKNIGKVKNKNSDEVKGNYFGIGLEKLDRSLYDPGKVYEKIRKTGVKLVRIQSGWAKTEKTEGVYDFIWLDEIVDNLHSRGMEPWICLCYGNPVYTPEAKDEFVSVSYPPVKTQAEREAWIKYCLAIVERYQSKVSKYEIWNEPEWLWKYGADAREYGKFAMLTAKALREAYPDLYIIAGAMTHLDAVWTDRMLATGLYKYADAISYHRYSPYVEDLLRDIVPVTKIAAEYGIKDIIQGESGCQSAPFGAGALAEGAWSEDKQVKLLLRRELIDLKTQVRFSSYFTSVDVREALANVDGQGNFGILKNVTDENGKFTGEYTEKPSYYALQKFISAFDGEISLCDINVIYCPKKSKKYYTVDEDGSDFISQGLLKANGAKAFVYYKPTNIMTTVFSSTVSFTAEGIKGKPQLVDLYDGTIYEFEKEYVEETETGYCFANIPVKDYPIMITFGDFLD